MSGFQIPGLGQAKPNETLPPLPADVLAAAASARGNEELPDAPEENGDAKPSTEEKTNTDQAPTTQQENAVSEDAMVVDQAASPPSLTSALEASIGGLDQQPAQEPEMLEPAALQNDTSANPEWEIDSSPYQSSDSSSSESSSDEDDSDNEGYELLGVEETARLLMAEGGSDDEGERGGKTGNAAQLRTKNELAEEAIPKPDVTITPDMKLEELGVIEHIVDTIALIKAFTPGEYQVLDSGSVICTAERVVIGAINETIGKVVQPMYTVIFSSEEDVKELGLGVGSKVYYTPEHATFIFTEPLKNMKGSDASNLYDEEAGDDDVEFSDDEKEAEHKRAIKQRKKDKWKNANGKAATSSNDHPLRREMNVDGGLNYDDDDGPYKPLARPSSMVSGPSTETYESQPRGGFRGGRRGDSRGRSRGFARGRGGRPSDGYSMPPQSQNQYQQPPSNVAAPLPPPSAVNFGFQVPGWPQGGAAAPPPPPPGWQPGQQANPQMVDPAMLAAFMSHIQQQGGANQQSGWGAPPPPPGQ